MRMYFLLSVTDVDGCGGPIGRAVPDHDTTSLSDYRIRYGLYRTDPNLIANHQNFAWIPTWDDVYPLLSD
jgi:alkaline phosphatase D